ncbi:DUF4873 domain-containing protein [Streptomyces sp. NBC_00859]|uniref:DUF4873 domain-containing protein n=1 Tax=Streptomyces sp. NBC_00859 TaxID=2903682 RepID=UPI00386DA983|nr:DUF4873 domain-containing protein [Streptomyces sp. NBC_00859]
MTDEDDIGYEGPAVVIVNDTELAVTVRLAGYFQPIDGRYHWYGRVTGNPAVGATVGSRKTACVLATSAGAVEAEISEPDLWDRYRIRGVGAPPFHVISTVEEVS